MADSAELEAKKNLKAAFQEATDYAVAASEDIARARRAMEEATARRQDMERRLRRLERALAALEDHDDD